MSGWLAVDKASVISRHIPGMCQEAAESTYVLESDLRLWAEMPGKCLRDKCDIYMFLLACSTPKALKLSGRYHFVSGLVLVCVLVQIFQSISSERKITGLPLQFRRVLCLFVVCLALSFISHGVACMFGNWICPSSVGPGGCLCLSVRLSGWVVEKIGYLLTVGFCVCCI